jgi:hypothetical protein
MAVSDQDLATLLNGSAGIAALDAARELVELRQTATQLADCQAALLRAQEAFEQKVLECQEHVNAMVALKAALLALVQGG